MSKAQATRQKIIREAAQLFNRLGFAGASMGDIMAATGLKKGGIYNHFSSKDDIALAAFDYAIGEITQRYMAAIRQHRHARDRLLAMLEIYRPFLEAPPFPGGCPILNTAVDSDDTHPALRQRVQQAMDNWRSLIRRVLTKGIERQEIRPDLDVDEAATLLIASLEGAIMMSKLYDDTLHIERILKHLKGYLQSCSIS